MARKLSLLLAAVAVVAFAAPAFASASTVTDGSGVALPTGTELLGSSSNAVTETSLGNIECAVVLVEGELTQNSGGLVELVGLGEGEAFFCQVTGNPVAVTDITVFELVSSGSSHSGTAEVVYTADLPGVTCHFSSTSAPFTYSGGTNQIQFNKANLTGVPKACEPGLLTATFTLTQSGGSVVLD